MDRQSERIHLPEPGAKIHFIGIGGAGMSGLARMLLAAGFQVSGSDLVDSLNVSELRREGIDVAIGHQPELAVAAALVVISAAVPQTDSEVEAAAANGIPVVKRAQLLALLANERRCIAVAGTAGKSTTSGMLAYALDRAGYEPSFAIGAVISQLGTNARHGVGDVFVAEADEYDYSFLWLRPEVAVITNIAHDHPDLFPTYDDVLDAFERFVERIVPGGTLVISADDLGCRSLLERIDGRGEQPFRVVMFGVSKQSDWRLLEDEPGQVAVQSPAKQIVPLRLSLPGAHNRLNALAALAAASSAGADVKRLIPGLEAFSGVGRRFEVRGSRAGVTVIDDYAHHPAKIRATIDAARERFPGASLWVIFQPHTYSRTRAFLSEFAAELSRADQVILTAIYPARETDDLGVSSHSIARLVTGIPVDVLDSPVEAGSRAGESAQPNDVILVLGAGDSWKACTAALDRLQQREKAMTADDRRSC